MHHTPQAMNYRIIRYDPSLRGEWDRFVAASRNGTFLFMRDYMDYHSDRFSDCSWMAYKENRLMALLPANITPGGMLCSHGGLTYGGWVLPVSHLDGAGLLEIFGAACDAWRTEGIKALDYRPVPYIYCSRPSQEDEYALFRLGGRLYECNLSATIDLRRPVSLNKQQRRHLAGTAKLPLSIGEMSDIAPFMEMLGDCLRERHDTKPVHTVGEMRLLADRFPDNIRFFATWLDGEPHAAVCVYDTGMTAHAQYIATTPRGRELNLLTPLFHWLITERYSSRDYFDFGISNEDHGRYLNAGLLRQKYSYGATGTVYTRYRLEL